MKELDKSKAYDLRFLNYNQFIKIQEEFKKQGEWKMLGFEYAKKSPCVYYSKISERWYRDFTENIEIIDALELFK